MAKADLIPISFLREWLSYDSNTGIMRRRTGREVGSPTRGYLSFKLSYSGKRWDLYVHRVAWALMTGRWPDEIDHLDRDRTNNSFANLREVTRSENTHNRSGVRGAYPICGKWKALIQANGKHYYLGRFATEAEARAAYLKAKAKYHPSAPHHDE